MYSKCIISVSLLYELHLCIYCSDVTSHLFSRERGEALDQINQTYTTTNISPLYYFNNKALEPTRDRLNLTTEWMAKLSSSDVELDGMAEVGYYGIGPLSEVVQ